MDDCSPVKNPLDEYRQRLPWHGFGTNRMAEGLHFMAAPELVQRALIQYQARHSIGWLVYDLDSDTAMLDWEDRRAPAPNIIAINRTNGHAHLFYALEKPVHDYYGSSAKALRYCAAVDLALTELLGADPGYAKLIAKNPLHDDWLVFTPRADLYDLEELADYVDLTKYRDKRRRLPVSGLGRNCTLFETLRIWAYRARRQPYLSEEMFRHAVLNHGLVINTDLIPPLPHSEVRATAKSVAKWTWQRMSAEGFRSWQRRVAARSVAVRQRNARERHWQILETAQQCPALTQDEIAAICGCSRWTVNQVLVKARKEGVGLTISDKGVVREQDGSSPGLLRPSEGKGSGKGGNHD